MPAATFPTLPPQDILDSCKAYGCPMTIEDLQAPTPARAQAIYEWWMSRVLGLNAEDCVRAADAQLDRVFDDPREQALYREAMYLGVFAQALNQMLALAAIDDFTTRDLSAPTVLRIRHVLSGVINFFLFEQEQAAEFLEPLQDEQEELAAQETRLLQRNEELREQLAAEKDRRARNAARVEELQGEHGARQAQLQEATSVGHKNAEWAKRSKGERVEAGEAIRKLEESTTSLNLQLSRLSENLLASPARIHSEMHQMSSELASQQAKLRAISDKLAHDERKVDALHKYDADLHTCVKILEDWEADLLRLRDARARHEGHLVQRAGLEEEKADLANNIKVLNSKLVNAVEALQRYNQKTEDKRDALRQRKAGLEATQHDLLGRKAAVAEKAAERNKEAIEVEHEIRALHAEMHEELKRSEVAYTKIKDQVVAYSIALNAKIDSFNTLNSTDVNF